MTTLEEEVPKHGIELNLVIPCLTEAPTLVATIRDFHAGGCAAELPYEVVVADNGSSDGSFEIARLKVARFVLMSTRGYEAALRARIQEVQGSSMCMGDADSTYRFDQARLFLESLKWRSRTVCGICVSHRYPRVCGQTLRTDALISALGAMAGDI